MVGRVACQIGAIGKRFIQGVTEMMSSLKVRIRFRRDVAMAASFLAAAGIALLAPAGKAQADIHDSLVVHVRFDGDVLDYSGRGNNGTIVRPGASSPYVPGIIGQAYQTTGMFMSPDVSTSSYITLGTPDDLNFDGSCDVSFSWWGMYNASDQHDDIAWLSNKDWLSSSEVGWIIASQQGGGVIRVNFRSHGEAKIDYNGGGNANWGDGQWHHYVVTWTRGDGGTVYQDGALVAYSPFPTASVIITYPSPGTPATNIQTYATNIFQDGTGNYTDAAGGANWDNASIDDLGIWRRALTDDEISTIYNMGLQGISALD
jgi:hypothetical protein